MWGGFRYDVGDALEPDGALPARYGTMAMQASQQPQLQPPQLQLQPPQLPPPQLPPPPQLQSQSQSQQKRDMVLTISALVVMAVMLSYLERLNTRLRTLEMLVSKM